MASKITAGIAQLVEQRIRNAKVGGSTPLAGTILSVYAVMATQIDRPL